MAFLFSACGASESFIGSLSSSSPQEDSVISKSTINSSIHSMLKGDTKNIEPATPNTPDRSVDTTTTVATASTGS
eukprot:CAMPEP_0178935242 /NCGR_PEP_ID=MMETSP0786-20121207/24403_1 /TAXON_ID=186022 /ORGANISM="Thalassionema frauenfeldii, Strain CCMP 1798" /LENGTH=74 /DNA_ID=CAMNT_0020613301 /DNA_START=51 /DNA_END=272 /DNA_ORIENTATION=-